MAHWNRLSHRLKPQAKEPSAQGRFQYQKQNSSSHNHLGLPINSYTDLQRGSLQTGSANTPSQRYSSEKQIISVKSTQKKKETLRVKPRNCEVENSQDYIQTEEIGMSVRLKGKGVQSQSENAMKGEIDQQKAEIDSLNVVIKELKVRDKGHREEIDQLSCYIQQLVDELSNLKQQRSQPQPHSTHHLQETSYLRQQNQRLHDQASEMQEMIKTLLLQREKDRISLPFQ